MSSGFVSGAAGSSSDTKSDDWSEARRTIETTRRQEQEAGRQADGKSLYEVLQQNKTAKQEAFEESLRLKNQFRTLDEDEVDFLDNVLESTRAREAQVKKETDEGLETFRKKREAVDQAVVEASVGSEHSTADAAASAGHESWATSSRKRRRTNGKDDTVASQFRKKSSASIETSRTEFQSALGRSKAQLEVPLDDNPMRGTKGNHPAESDLQPILSNPPKASAQSSSTSLSLGLGAYSSDEQ